MSNTDIDVDKIRAEAEAMGKQIAESDTISIQLVNGVGAVYGVVFPVGTLAGLLKDIEDLCDELDYIEDHKWDNY